MLHRERTWIEISASAVRHNLRQFQRVVGSRIGIMPIIKANAYGHGLREMTKVLGSEKPAALGVAHGEEAIQLRTMNYRGRVVVLSSWQATDLAELIRTKIELVVWDWSSYQAVITAAIRAKVKPRVHLKLDTGTTRIGFLPTDITKLRRSLRDQASFKVVGLFSHFANAEERSLTRTKKQLLRFTTLDQELGLPSRVERHMACTAAILRYPEARFGLIRLGIGLYGLWPSDAIQAWARVNLPGLRLRPALAWYSRLVQVKTVPKGTGIGYGSTVMAKRPTRVGIVPIGYADGFDRRLSNVGGVIIKGRRAVVLGRVCMNLVMVDVSKIPTVRSDEMVTIIGRGSTVADWAEQTGALNYELVTRISPTIRRYIV